MEAVVIIRRSSSDRAGGYFLLICVGVGFVVWLTSLLSNSTEFLQVRAGGDATTGSIGRAPWLIVGSLTLTSGLWRSLTLIRPKAVTNDCLIWTRRVIKTHAIRWENVQSAEVSRLRNVPILGTSVRFGLAGRNFTCKVTLKDGSRRTLHALTRTSPEAVEAVLASIQLDKDPTKTRHNLPGSGRSSAAASPAGSTSESP
jgi:hypothetical protein